MAIDLAPRLADWPQRLAAFLQTRANTPFAWGKNDCCTFAADAIEAMTGQDPMKGRRSYASQKGALRVIESAGDFQALITSILGEPMRNPRMAARGDAVLIADATPQGAALGICLGATAAVAGDVGMAQIPLRAVVAAWSV